MVRSLQRLIVSWRQTESPRRKGGKYDSTPTRLLAPPALTPTLAWTIKTPRPDSVTVRLCNEDFFAESAIQRDIGKPEFSDSRVKDSESHSQGRRPMQKFSKQRITTEHISVVLLGSQIATDF